MEVVLVYEGKVIALKFIINSLLEAKRKKKKE